MSLNLLLRVRTMGLKNKLFPKGNGPLTIDHRTQNTTHIVFKITLHLSFKLMGFLEVTNNSPCLKCRLYSVCEILISYWINLKNGYSLHKKGIWHIKKGKKRKENLATLCHYFHVSTCQCSVVTKKVWFVICPLSLISNQLAVPGL